MVKSLKVNYITSFAILSFFWKALTQATLKVLMPTMNKNEVNVAFETVVIWVATNPIFEQSFANALATE